jgi:hypothetical protein
VRSGPLLGAALAASLLGLLSPVGPAAARPAPLDAQVIWVRGTDVYLAAPDSIAAMPGTLLTLTSRDKPFATATVTRVFDRGLAVARLTSGPLRELKDLRRVRVLAEPAPAHARLRVGYPSRARSHPLFTCGRMPFRRTWALQGYELDETAHLYRLTKDPRHSHALAGEGRIPWPDTLEVQLFDDPADQEIALERGELDVAVFWPGELSTHMRDHPRWKARLSAVAAWGYMGAIRLGPEGGDGALTSPERDALAALNREMFRGDLEERRDGIGRTKGPATGVEARTRFEVDAGCPGKAALEASLNRGLPPRAAGGEPVLHLFRLDCACKSPREVLLRLADHVRSGLFLATLGAGVDSLAATAPSMGSADPAWSPDRDIRYPLTRLGVSFPLAIACPVLCDPALLPYVGALGAHAFVDLLECCPRER